jgi:hypothetical protein
MAVAEKLKAAINRLIPRLMMRFSMSSPGSDKTISDSIAPVIAAAAERIHYAESRRVNYTVMALALIAGGTSILVFALGSLGEMWLKYAAIATSFGFITVGLFVIYTYGRQTNQYPYTSATKTWKWFYRDALPDRSAFGLTLFERSNTRKKRITAAYANQLPIFKAEIAKLNSEKANAEQDIEQLYSLHVNELYKNLYLSRLRTIFNRGLIGTILVAIGAGLWGWYSEDQANSLQTSSFGNRGWSQRIEYRLLSEPLAETADVTIHLVITNNGSAPISVSGLVVRDKRGWPLPIEVRSQKTLPQTVGPHRSGDIYAGVHTTRSIWSEHNSIDAQIK